jgi:hypothetical protein
MPSGRFGYRDQGLPSFLALAHRPRRTASRRSRCNEISRDATIVARCSLAPAFVRFARL